MPGEELPVRLCCGQRHAGVQCPDGLVMCYLCFDRVPVGQLAVEKNGKPIDVCRDCHRMEQEDRLYLDLRGALTRLRQVHRQVPSPWAEELEDAINRVNLVGSRIFSVWWAREESDDEDH